MDEAIDAPDEMSLFAPRIITIKIPVDKIGEVIGPKGKVINQIQDDTGAQITIEDDGTIYVGAVDGDKAEAARAMINAIANPKLPERGERYLGTVVKITAFGAFVSLLPGKDGLLHISKLRPLAGGKRVENVEDVCRSARSSRSRSTRSTTAASSRCPGGRGRTRRRRPRAAGHRRLTRRRPCRQRRRRRRRPPAPAGRRPEAAHAGHACARRYPDHPVGAARPGSGSSPNRCRTCGRSALGVWVGVGSVDEPESLAGATHYLEHWLFRRTRKRTGAEINKLIDGAGGLLNAFTSKEFTCLLRPRPRQRPRPRARRSR